jgi:hypothetical protein
MKKNLINLCLAFALLASCQKDVNPPTTSGTTKTGTTTANTNEFVKYTIKKGEQYCDKNTVKKISYEQLSFVVKFDSSAIYKTSLESNQGDINKLFGFSDNNKQHHEFSARFGWRWYNHELHLLGYIYNNGVMSFKEVGTVKIGTENSCAITVQKDTYIFNLNGNTVTMPRASITPKAEGYKLYPYFGGDELAPHTVSIWIKEIVK